MSFASRLLLKTFQASSIFSHPKGSLVKIAARNLSAVNAQEKLRTAERQTQSAEATPKIVKPFENPDFFDVKKLVKLEELFE